MQDLKIIIVDNFVLIKPFIKVVLVLNWQYVAYIALQLAFITKNFQYKKLVLLDHDRITLFQDK